MKANSTGTSPVEAVFFDPLSEDLPVDAWQALSNSALDANPFFRPAFLQPFLRHMEARRVRLAVMREQATGRWLMAAPIGRRTAGLVLPVPTVWTTEYSPLGTPLMEPDVSDDQLKAFVEGASGATGILAIPYLPTACGTARRLTTLSNVATTTASVFERASHQSGSEGQAQFDDAFKGKRRKEMRRLLRRLEDYGAVSLSSAPGPEIVNRFDQFLDLEASGWKGREDTALGSKVQTATFSREVVEALAGQGHVRIDELRAGDSLVASLVSFVDGGCVFTWKIAFDEEFARFSPGAQLVMHTFQENLVQPDFKIADSLAVPGHSMIEPLWRGRIGLGTLLLASSPLAALKSRLCAADISLEQTLRQMARAARAKLKS